MLHQVLTWKQEGENVAEALLQEETPQLRTGSFPSPFTVALSEDMLGESCKNNFSCSNSTTAYDSTQIGCCNGFCQLYAANQTGCDNTGNRPLGAVCYNNSHCGGTCCGADGTCVPPLLDCMDQMPLAIFASIMIALLILLCVLYIIVDRIEKKRRIERIKK